MSTHGPTYIYSGIGAWPVSADLTQQMLEKAIDSRGIKKIDSLSNLEKETRLIAIPGGHAGDMYELIETARNKVDQFVKGGGKLLGICAGGIISTETLITKSFKTTPLDDENIHSLRRQGLLTDREYNSKSELFATWSLYPGKCVAPHIVKNSNDSESLENLCAVDVIPEYAEAVKSFKMFHFSGPAFIETPLDAKVLLRYQDPVHLQKVKSELIKSKRLIVHTLTGERIDCEKPVAALSYPYGKGKIVLTGIHPEMDYSIFPASAAKHNFPHKLPTELEASEPLRKAFVNKIFSELNII